METHGRRLGGRRKHSRRAATIAFLLIISTIGCELFAPKGDCTADPRYALSVTITDSISGRGSLSGATVVARDGSYADSVQFPADPSSDRAGWYMVLNRPGLYTLSVRKSGYKDWTRNRIRVNSGYCGPERVNVFALLQRVTP